MSDKTTPTNDERERMAREAFNKLLGKFSMLQLFQKGVTWADANPKPVGDFREMAEEIVSLIGNIANRPDIRAVQEEQIKRIESALSHATAETEARVRAETIEECAKVCDSDSESTAPVTRYYGNVIAKLIRALASNSSREGEK